MNANSDKDYIDVKIEAVRAGMDGRLDAFEANVNGRFAELNAKIDKSVAELRKDIAEFSARMVQWMVGIFLASMAIFITLITFVLNNAVPKTAPATPPVIIQLSPQGLAIPPPAAPAAKPQP
nr:hypothetical protein [uncultured Duganella sp.]